MKGSNGKVTHAELKDGTLLEADMVIFGAGVQPATQFVKGAVDLDKDGSVKCDAFLRSSDKDIFAAGDVASFPFFLNGQRVRVEHWNHALQQGHVASYNMLGKVRIPSTNIFRKFHMTLFHSSGARHS